MFNARTGKLTAQASNAIKRIFNIADHNFNDVIEKVQTINCYLKNIRVPADLTTLQNYNAGIECNLGYFKDSQAILYFDIFQEQNMVRVDKISILDRIMRASTTCIWFATE